MVHHLAYTVFLSPVFVRLNGTADISTFALTKHCAQIYIFVTERTVPFGVLACLLILCRDLDPYLVLLLRWEAR